MRTRVMARVVCAGMICSSGLALAAPAKAPALIVINAIEPGQWELRELGAGKSPRLICVANPDTLIQLRHAGATCARYVIDNQPQTMTVNYSCDGTGNGRTTITLQTPRQLRLQTQGIAQGAPFDVDYTARRVGDCVIASH